MIRLDVTGIDGRPPEEPISAEFSEAGGSIGRAAGNALVLPDPDRRISRTQATIAVRGGRYMIYDVGSATPVLVNGRMLGRGREAPVHPGDEIRIGVYTMRVEAGASASMPSAAGARPAASASQPQDDPFDVPPARSPASGHVTAPTPPAGRAIIPEDAEFDLGPGPASGQRLDEAFDLDSAGAGGDPFGSGHPLGEPISQPNTAAVDDPIASLEAAPRTPDPSAPQRDDTPEIHAAWPMPDRPLASPGNPGSPLARQPEGDGMFVSWDRPSEAADAIRTVIIPSRALGPTEPGAAAVPTAASLVSSTLIVSVAPAAPTAPTTPTASTKSTAPALPATPVMRTGQGAAAAPSPPPAPTAAPAASYAHATDASLLAAFLAGAGMPTLQLPGGLTPERMETFGRLFREATQGTLDLLVARALAKRELRAQMTVIVARENNPLKFSPTVEAALAHLLAPQEGHGFMPPLRAMRDAYDDLRAHQLAFMAGMRAALAGVLARFDPAQLEGRLTQKSVIDSVLPMHRKAKLWDLFEDLFADLSREAEDDFHALFGREFLRAYEAQLARLEDSGDGRPERRGDDHDAHGRRQPPDREGGA